VKVVNNAFAAQVEREIRALKELNNHPNIVSLHGKKERKEKSFFLFF
jgi:serine/threonine protein kinase